MSNFLQVYRFKSQIEQGKRPLIVEDIPVDPLTAPYLITSTTGVVWVEKPHPGDVLRVAVRTVTPGEIFTELLQAIIERSLKEEWGSVLPYTGKGLGLAFEYLDF